VAGLVASISQNTTSGAHFEDLLRRKIPLVLFDRICADVVASKVVTDEYKNAFGAYQKIKEAGLKIPGDIALVGFSNNKITSLIDPPMATVDQPSFEMGKRAAELLIDAIEGRLKKRVTVFLDAQSVIRGST
jgi:hypothetical protein